MAVNIRWVHNCFQTRVLQQTVLLVGEAYGLFSFFKDLWRICKLVRLQASNCTSDVAISGEGEFPFMHNTALQEPGPITGCQLRLQSDKVQTKHAELGA